MIEIRNNADGTVDEVVHTNNCANFHLESCGNGYWMLIVEANGDVPHRAHITITPTRAIVYESLNCNIVTEKQSDG